MRLTARTPAKAVRFNRSSEAGFTITELFVVIIIMAVLSAILLPALNKGKSRSQAISCLNNLRQLQHCWQMYADDNDGILPANNYVNGFKLNNFTVNTGLSWCPGNAMTDTTTENIQRGQLFQYNRSTAIYHCPSDNSKVQGVTGADPKFRTRSYNMSGSIGCDVFSVSPSFSKSSEIVNPSPDRLFVFVDGHEDMVMDSHFALFPDQATQQKDQFWINMPSDRHGQAGNISFADGHMERWKWAAPKKFLNEWPQKINGAEDLADMKKLQSSMRQR